MTPTWGAFRSGPSGPPNRRGFTSRTTGAGHRPWTDPGLLICNPRESTCGTLKTPGTSTRATTALTDPALFLQQPANAGRLLFAQRLTVAAHAPSHGTVGCDDQPRRVARHAELPRELLRTQRGVAHVHRTRLTPPPLCL